MNDQRQEGLSRQRRWQLARIAEGRCSLCGKPRCHYTTMCDECALAKRRRERVRHGLLPWKPGGGGRPPLLVEPTRKPSRKRRQPGSDDQSRGAQGSAVPSKPRPGRGR